MQDTTPTSGATGLQGRRTDGSDLATVVARLPPIFGAKTNYVGLARPGSADELAIVMRDARARRLRVLRIYNSSKVGARLAGDGDALIVDMSRLNRILEVNAEYGYARVEPGVSFSELARHLAERHLPLLLDSERDPEASIAGSIYSKGHGFTPYADHVLMQCGGEYVLSDGDRLRTGMGAMPDNRTWQLYKYSLGPYSDGVAVQSDVMLHVQTGVWLMGRPPEFRAFAFDLADSAALAGAFETLRPLKLANLLPGPVTIAHRDFDAARSGQDARKAGWRLHGAFYGSARLVELTAVKVLAGLSGIPGAALLSEGARAADPLCAEQEELMAGGLGRGAPAFTKAGFPEGGTMTFAMPIEGLLALTSSGVARRVVEAEGLPWLEEFSLLGRSALHTLHLPYDRRRPETLAAVERAARNLVPAMAQAGLGLVAESVEFSRLAQHSLDASGLSTLQRRIADAFA